MDGTVRRKLSTQIQATWPGLAMLPLTVSPSGKASRPTAFFTEDYGRLRTVVTSPDDQLWLTTSNRDGRGDPTPDDDRVVVIQP